MLSKFFPLGKPVLEKSISYNSREKGCSVKTSVYIYGVPIITMVISMIVLHERLTLMSALGTVLTLGGLVLSDKKSARRKKEKPSMPFQNKQAL
ncbi:EamA family transporter [Bacillus pumilus]|nr:EamA family transporter [Bacillus pumilus]QHQ82224.1 EamA family transporter [Bacillus subtilis]